MLNKHSKCNTVQSKIHFSTLLFLQFYQLGKKPFDDVEISYATKFFCYFKFPYWFPLGCEIRENIEALTVWLEKGDGRQKCKRSECKKEFHCIVVMATLLLVIIIILSTLFWSIFRGLCTYIKHSLWT